MAKLNVIRSNRLETLVDLMGERLRTQLPANPIAPIDVVVGSRGMERWLRHRLAMHFGICCNMHFPFPAMKFDALVTNILGESMVEREAWGGASLAFAILDVLPLLVERQEFEAVHGYLASWDAPVSAKAFGLAGQLAAMFERYIDYRPELACAWSRGAQKAAEDDSMHEWQRILWVEVQQRLERPHRAARVAAAIERLKAEQNSHREPLHLFGLTSLPPVWLALIEAYAHHGDVDIYLPCASDSAWQFLRDCIRKDRARWREMSRDTMAEALREEYRRSARPALHPLLLSMGRASRHFQIQLETFVDEENMTDQGRFEGFGRSALRRLQSDVLGATAPTERETLANTDDSLQFHACYGEIRQVEVLRDVLLGLLEDHRDLEPRDIVVLCPDIETLGPLITAVFSQGPSARHRKDGEPVQGADGWGPVGAPRIPFEVMDASIRRLNPVADALLRLLELAEGRFEASAVLDLLSLEPVHRRFSLDDKDLVMLREWVRSSGIRWGRDAADRKRHGQPLDSQNTWRFGLRRLLLGVVLADDGRMVAGREANGEPTNVLPFDDMEGASTAGLGKLVDFLNTLIEVTESLRRARPMTEWVSALEEALDRLTATSKAASWLTLRTRQAIRELGMDAGGSERLVTREAVTSALSRSMEVLSRATKEQCGAMVFGCLRPMRSVPYRVVCLLGMDDGKFPRKNEMLAFDRTAMAPRAADPSPCDEDRLLLLEALLAAEDHFIVFYTGRDPNTNEPRPACVPIGELRDVIDRTFLPPEGAATPSQWLTKQHPLQSFAESCFLSIHRNPMQPEHPRPWSFDRRLLASATIARGSRVSPPFYPVPSEKKSVPEETIRLEDLISFFKNPTAYLLRRRWKLWLEERPEAVEDREPIELAGLERWQLRQALLDKRLAGTLENEVLERMRAEGRLPLGFAGEALVQGEASSIDALLEKTGIWRKNAKVPQQPAAPLSVDISLPSARLIGTVHPIYGSLLFDFRFGGESTRTILGLWLRLLAWHASEKKAGKAVLALSDGGNTSKSVKLIGYQAPDDCAQVLEPLVQIYRRGCVEPIKLFAGASWSFAWAARDLASKPKVFDKALPDDAELLHKVNAAYEKALEAWFPAYNSPGDVGDPYVSRLFDGLPPMTDRK